MRPREDELIDPEIAEQLDAIDATLAGEPVAPRFAELAELALLLSVARPEAPSPEFAAELDRRVEGRFGASALRPVGARGGSARGGSARGGGRWRHCGGWNLRPVLGTAVGAVAAVAVVVVVLSGGGTGTPGETSALVTHAMSSAATTSSPRTPLPAVQAPATAAKSSARAILGPVQTVHGPGGGAAGAKASPVLGPVAARVQSTKNTTSSAISPAAGAGTAGVINGPAAASAPGPIPNGRKIVQSSTLQLGAPANRIDAVAQGVFNVVGTVSGIVDSSNVASTRGPGASAQFQLRVPSAQLALALTDLSRLRYAHVVARTDNTRDINNSFVSARRQIADAQAAVARLRTELAAATLATQIAGLRAQMTNEKATIARAQGSLSSLNRQVNYSRVAVSIQATTTGGGPASGGGGFGLSKAGHDALRVLEITAGVALITLAVLVPVGLLAALGWWLSTTVQRRRRERTLDLA
ncbi:MAG: DUF4349 domain-containing protein [Actinomycetota bacterium]|nr:DUF4349 domain-containing protein [Actinomycetota bacterium]